MEAYLFLLLQVETMNLLLLSYHLQMVLLRTFNHVFVRCKCKQREASVQL